MSSPTPHRKVDMPAGTTMMLDFATTYDANWSVEENQGEPIVAEDVTGARFLLKRNLADGDDDAAVEKTLDDGITVSEGLARVALDPGDTKDLQGAYLGTLRLFLAGGAVVDWRDSAFEKVPYIELDITQGAVEAVE